MLKRPTGIFFLDTYKPNSLYFKTHSNCPGRTTPVKPNYSVDNPILIYYTTLSKSRNNNICKSRLAIEYCRY